MTDRKTALWGITDSEDKLFLSAMCDRCARSEKTDMIVYTRFLTPRQVSLAGERLGNNYDIRFFGGYDGADRLMGAFVPNSWEEPCYPISLVSIRDTGKKELGHRDYMGSILGLGISRELIGDIVVNPKGAYVFVCSEIAEFIEQNLTKVASSGVRVTILDSLEDISVERRFEDSSSTVSSMRLDCVISAATGKSRSGAALLIEDGLVSVNYDIVKNVSHTVKDKDVVSVRGFGKMIILTDMYLTKKGRIHINIRKYI